ncbi:hypothetical protein BELL_0353g00090 [Botrytis elliptica]|uniref:Uncharacterized protein n=1 Tax=Botrytis elliptica TaxID=278938 RepID=A0A4Z1JIJ4_9HELO|nr:hypothetical protein EAE99_009625 [Botrytis elliptica]TGO73535.1 hypothetical protein BELL_0353g00090 [Botrytis elliptica]
MKFPTIEPEDKFPRVPNALAFIIYRFLPIFCLTTFTCWFFQRNSLYVSDWDIYWMYMPIFTSIPVAMGGSCYSENGRKGKTPCEDFILSKNFSPSEKLSQVRLLLESYDESRSPNFPFGFRRKSWTAEQRKREIQLQKERFAISLSGSRQGIPSLSSFREHLYLFLIWMVTSFLIVRVFRPEVRSWDHFLGYLTFGKIHHILYFVCILILLGRFNFQYGMWASWNVATLGGIGKVVRYYCGRIDYERATENKRTELEWWIEGILRDNSDSFALAEERRRVIIAPIQSMIRENTFCEGLSMACTARAQKKRELEDQICDDCESAHCCLSKNVKLQ